MIKAIPSSLTTTGSRGSPSSYQPYVSARCRRSGRRGSRYTGGALPATPGRAAALLAPRRRALGAVSLWVGAGWVHLPPRSLPPDVAFQRLLRLSVGYGCGFPAVRARPWRLPGGAEAGPAAAPHLRARAHPGLQPAPVVG